MNQKSINPIISRMVKARHTNVRGDGICPWCHTYGGNVHCDLEKLRKIFDPGVQVMVQPRPGKIDLFEANGRKKIGTVSHG